MRIEDDALTLRRIPFRDASQIVVLLTRRHGVCSVVAQGVRRSKGEARGALHGFHRLQVEIRSRGLGVMGTLQRVEIGQVRHRLPFMPVALAGAQLLEEVVYRFVLPGDVQQGEIFAIMEDSLDALEAERVPLAVVGGTLGQLLRVLGYGWRVDACVGCGGEKGLIYFSLRRGATVCDECGRPYVNRLLTLNESLRQVMMGVDWPPVLKSLSNRDLSMLYRMGLARLEMTGGKSLVAALGFHRLAGVEC